MATTEAAVAAAEARPDPRGRVRAVRVGGVLHRLLLLLRRALRLQGVQAVLAEADWVVVIVIVVVVVVVVVVDD